MKKTIAVLLSAMLVFGLAGCGNDSEGTTKGKEGRKEATSIVMGTEDTAQKDSPVSVNTDSEKAESEVKPVTKEDTKAATDAKTTEDKKEQALQNPSTETDTATLDGLWHSISIGEDAPRYYVQFTDEEIQYGHLEDDKFVMDRADKISRMERTKDNGFLIQAQSESGTQYSFRTSVEDKDTLEYFKTWEEEAFDTEYYAGSSLIRSMT